MCRPGRWLPGLIPLFLLFLALLGVKWPEVRRDLEQRAAAVAAAEGIADAAVRADGRDIRLSGMSYTDAGAKIADKIDSLDGVRLVAGGLTQVGVAKPYVFAAAKEGGAVTLSGSAPDPATRAAVSAAAGKVAAAVQDQLGFARGAPSDWPTLSAAAIGALAPLARGRATLTDSALTVTGEAADSASYKAALAALKSLPKGLTLAKAEIKPPVLSPFAWSASVEGGKVVLEGGVPSEEARAAILAAARAAFPGREIVDRMEVAGGGADGFVGWARAGLEALSRLGQGKASLSEASLSLAGAAADSAAYDRALAALKGLPAGLSLGKVDVAPPALSPFAWTAVSDGKTLILQGGVPSEEARAAILAAARAANPGLAIVDRMFIARTAPEGFLDSARAALGAIAGLGAGKASLSDQSLSISGLAKVGETVEGIMAKLKAALGKGFALAETAVRPAEQHPFTLTAKKSPDGAVAIDGFAPSEALRAAVAAAARKAGERVSGDSLAAAGWPAALDYGASAALGFDVLGRLKSGEMILEEDGLTVRGEGDEARVAETRTLLSALPPGVRLKLADLVARAAAPPTASAPAAVPPPASPAVPQPSPAPAPRRPLNEAEAACQQKLLDRLSKETIVFRTGSADIGKESEGLIHDLSKVLLGCPEVKVEVAGHTDNVGDPAFNKNLSQARAAAVVEALGVAGVPAGRLEAAGYGEERPVASNDTREGRAANRRTEFVVK